MPLGHIILTLSQPVRANGKEKPLSHMWSVWPAVQPTAVRDLRFVGERLNHHGPIIWTGSAQQAAGQFMWRYKFIIYYLTIYITDVFPYMNLFCCRCKYFPMNTSPHALLQWHAHSSLASLFDLLNLKGVFWMDTSRHVLWLRHLRHNGFNVIVYQYANLSCSINVSSPVYHITLAAKFYVFHANYVKIHTL